MKTGPNGTSIRKVVEAILRMAKEQFFSPESADLLKTVDDAARRSAVSRGQAFEDF